MTAFFRSLGKRLMGQVASPNAALRDLLSENLDTLIWRYNLRSSVSAYDVPQWLEWTQPSYGTSRLSAGEVEGWREGRHPYLPTTTEIIPLVDLVVQKAEIWSGDIAGIEGVSMSKSILASFANLDAMVEKNAPDLLAPLTQDRLDRNLAHHELRILHPNGGDYFRTYGWDHQRRVFLINAGGSHHFAAARFIATRLGQAVPLQGRIDYQRLDEHAVHALCASYDLFAIPEDAREKMLLALRSDKVVHMWKPMPSPYLDGLVVFLPKDDERIRGAAALMRKAGLFDVGRHLTDVCGPFPHMPVPRLSHGLTPSP